MFADTQLECNLIFHFYKLQELWQHGKAIRQIVGNKIRTECGVGDRLAAAQ